MLLGLINGAPERAGFFGLINEKPFLVLVHKNQFSEGEKNLREHSTLFFEQGDFELRQISVSKLKDLPALHPKSGPISADDGAPGCANL